MKRLKIDYSAYINKIEYMLHCLESGRYTEKSGANMDGYLANNIIKLRDELNELMYWLQKNEMGIEEPDRKIFESYNEKKLKG